MTEKRTSRDVYHIEQLANGNRVIVHPGSITRFLNAAKYDTGETVFELKNPPNQTGGFSEVYLTGRDISTQQHGAIDLVANLHTEDIDQYIHILRKLKVFLDSPEQYDQPSPFTTFSCVGESDVIMSETPLLQDYLIIPDINGLTFRLINNGAACYSEDGDHVITRASSFEAVDAKTQVLEFCRIVAEFIDTVKAATGGTNNTITNEATTYNFQLAGYDKRNKATIDLSALSIGVGRTALSATRKALPMPKQEIIREPDAITFNDIAGYDDIKQQLQESILLFKNPEISQRYGIESTKGILLYGPEGTGKSTLALACASALNATSKVVTSEMIYDMWVGNSAKKITAIFDEAEKAQQPTVLIFEEFDTIVNGSGNSGVDKSVIGTLKQRLSSIKNSNVLVIATTNNRDTIDPTVLRSGRFDEKIKVPLPNQNDRAAIFAKFISQGTGSSYTSIDTVRADLLDTDEAILDTYLYADDIKSSELARLTEDFSGADINELLRRIKRKKLMHELHTGEVSKICQQDIEQAIKQFNINR